MTISTPNDSKINVYIKSVLDIPSTNTNINNSNINNTNTNNINNSNITTNKTLQSVTIREKTFNFSKIFKKDSNAEIFDLIGKKHVDEALKGNNSTIFCYGQTGTGKTYTMEGDNNNCVGLIQNCAKYLFDYIKQYNNEVSIILGFKEVYNENIENLLKEESTPLKNFSEFENIYLASKLQRKTRSTNLNTKSSRSHSILTFYLKFNNFKNLTSKLNFVDLAGSENLKLLTNKNEKPEKKKTKLEYFQNEILEHNSENIDNSFSENKLALETGNINKSLLCLRELIKKLSEEDFNQQINYRNSKLTMLLKDSMTLNSKISIVGCINTENYGETVNTMKFLERAKTIKMREQENKQLFDFDADIINLEIKNFLNGKEINSEKIEKFIEKKFYNFKICANKKIESLISENTQLKMELLNKIQIPKLETVKEEVKNIEYELEQLRVGNSHKIKKFESEYERFLEDERRKIENREDLVIDYDVFDSDL